jgi:type II secretory pathway pseudopilin PulG
LFKFHQPSERGRGAIESAFVLIILSILTAVVFFYLQHLVRESRETALKAELVHIRQSVAYFKMTNQRQPQDLQELIRKKFVDPARPDTFFERQYLEPNAVDKEGQILDPFGNPYQYDPETGEVRSESEGYRDW